MADLISRQVAIDALHMHLMYRMGTDSNKKRLDDWINSLPSAQRTGRWIYDDEAYPGGNPYGHYECDQCGECVPHRTNYCPNCGADMRGGQE